jgi:hypothetical protein
VVKALAAIAALLLALAVVPLKTTSVVFAQGPDLGRVPPPAPTYRGPTALFDPDDPFQSLQWTLGITLPPRNRLGSNRLGLAPRVDYDADRSRVLLSYQAGGTDILPPLAMTRGAYADRTFATQLRRSWIESNRRVLSENQNAERRGLVNLSLPFQLPFTEKIFGEGAPNLRVSGNEQITFSGTSSWVVGQVTGERGGGSLFPKLDMRQRLNVNLQGTIGSKLFIDVAQNSEALTPLENSIKIRYKGGEDEVVKSVELGNTNLSLPSTQFVSFSTRQEGLFGVKATAEVGDIGVTAIASRQEGESGQTTITGGAKQQTKEIKDYEFLSARYFFLSDPDGPIPNIPAGAIHVYLDDNNTQNDAEQGALPAEVWIDPDAKTPTGAPAEGTFQLLRAEDDYTVYNNQNFSLPVLVLRNGLSENQVLAVAYRRITSQGDTVDVGTYNTAGVSTLQLKMLRPNNSTWGTEKLDESPWGSVRRLELRNVYSLGATNLDPETFDLKIVKDIGGTNRADMIDSTGKSIPYLQVFGLDQRNNDDASDYTPDNKVDPEFIDYTAGVLFFPDLRPFDPSAIDMYGGGDGFRGPSWPIPDPKHPERRRPYVLNSDERVPGIYDLRYNYLRDNWQQSHLYNIETNYKTAVNTIQLNTGLGQILENSETVRLNGEVLQRGTDYTIFYDTGVITLKSDRATAPGADLVVTYNYDSPFTAGSRSLVGASIGTKVTPESKFSFSTSWLHESRGVPERRPRLGNEPTKTTVGDFSGQLRLTPWTLTEWVDKLPLVSTTVPSQISLTGAMGLSFPNPNSRNVVYVDDMEGAEVVTSAGMNRYNWFWSSPPAAAVTYPPGSTSPLDATPRATDRGKLLWFSPTNVLAGDITPGLETDTERNDQVPVLETIYIPQKSPAGPNGSWGGLVTALAGTGGTDLSTAQYIDIWVNDYRNYLDQRDQRRGEILIDLGAVSEDAVWDPLTPPAPPDGTLNTEDRNNLGGQVDYAKDLGLDGVADGDEKSQPDKERFAASSASQDPAGDDRYPTTIDLNAPERSPKERLAKYLGINGTERNQQTDTEDLNKDGILQKSNNYVEYRVDLSAPAFTDLGRDYPDNPRFTRAGNGWRLYRIPLSEVYNQVGTMDFTAVQDMRIWFRGIGNQLSGDPDTLDLQIASIEVVGNRWQVSPSTQLASDELFNVAVVNNKENANYKSPFGIQRTNGVLEREQSISLEFEKFRNGNELRAYRPIQTSSDYTLYQTVGFYVSPQFEAPDDTVEFYLRFGSDAATDTLSYYEVSTILTQDDPRLRADHWLDLKFNITDLSRLKLNAPPGTPADSFLVGGPPAEPPPTGGYGGGGRGHFTRTSENAHSPPVQIGDGLYVTIRGLPSFSRVRRLSVGLRNKSGHEIPQGAVWFDELRMGDVRKDVGVAGRAAVSLTLADLASLQAGVSTTSADFLRLGQTRGSGTTQLSYNLGTQVNLNKFAEGLRLRAPLRFNIKKDRQTPKFVPNSDVEYTGGGSGQEITEQGQKDISLSLNRDSQGLSPPLARYTVDAMNVGGSAGSSYNLGVNQVDSTKRVNGNFTYSPSFSQVRPLRLLNRVSFRPWPTGVSLGLTGGTSEAYHYSRDERNPELLTLSNQSKTRTGIMTLSTNLQPLGSLVGWSWNSTRDLIDNHFGPDSSIVRLQRPPGSFFGINIGRETQQTQSTNFNYTPPLMGALRPRFNWNSTYSRNSDPNLTRADYDSTVIELSNRNSANLVMTLPVGRTLRKIFGSPSEDQGRDGTPGPTQVRSRLPQPPPRNRVPAPADTAGDGKAGEEEPKGPGTLDRLRFLFGRYIVLSDIQTSATYGKSSSFTGIHGDAPLAYRLGLTRDVGLGSNVLPVDRAPFNQVLGETRTYRGNGSVRLFNKLSMDFSYQKQKDRNRTNNGVGRVEDSTTWPELRFNWGDIHKRLPLIKTLFTDFRTVSTTYSRQTRKSGTELNPNESISIARNWRPLVSIQGTLKGNWRTNFSANLGSTTTQSQREGSAGLTSEQSTVSYNMTLGKRFSRGGGPGLGKDVDLTIDGTYSKQTNTTRSTSGISPNDRATDNFQLRVNASLKFTQTMSGTFGLNFAQNRDLTKHWTQRSLGLSFTTGFNF